MPYKKLNLKLMPKKLASKLKLDWRPILSAMEKAPGIPNIGTCNVSIALIETFYTIGTEYLKTTVCSYVWQKYKKHDSWTVSTWCKRFQYKTIMTKGTKSDKANLPPPIF